ncbi:MAG: motif family protein [Verrucomicrobiota bacterium]|jgi:Spy/CpxP family protein refolding chaperone
MLSTLSVAYAQEPQGQDWKNRRHRDGGNILEHMTKNLALTPEQQAKIQPILDQAKPQIIAARQEAMGKMKAIRDATRAQIRAVLTPEQQQKFDALQKAREDMRKARQEMRDARKQ